MKNHRKTIIDNQFKNLEKIKEFGKRIKKHKKSLKYKKSSKHLLTKKL